MVTGLWDKDDGFYYDHVRNNCHSQPLKIKSMVGLVPLFCTLVLKDSDFKQHPGFHKRTKWFMENRRDLAKRVIINSYKYNRFFFNLHNLKPIMVKEISEC